MIFRPLAAGLVREVQWPLRPFPQVRLR